MYRFLVVLGFQFLAMFWDWAFFVSLLPSAGDFQVPFLLAVKLNELSLPVATLLDSLLPFQMLFHQKQKRKKKVSHCHISLHFFPKEKKSPPLVACCIAVLHFPTERYVLVCFGDLGLQNFVVKVTYV